MDHLLSNRNFRKVVVHDKQPQYPLKSNIFKIAGKGATFNLLHADTTYKLGHVASWSRTARAAFQTRLLIGRFTWGNWTTPQSTSGCLLFTKRSRKIWLEIKWKTTFRVVPVENFRKKRNIWKGSPGLFTIYKVKPVGSRVMQMVSKTSRIGDSVRDCPVPFVEFYVIYREPGTSLTVGAGPGTGRNDQMERTFPVWKFRLGILDYLSKSPVFSGKFSVWETEIGLPIYSPTNISGFIG